MARNKGIYTIAGPGKNDVVCGKGANLLNHTGNFKFEQYIVPRKKKYQAATRDGRRGVVKDALREWRGMDPPGCFLQLLTTKGEVVKLEGRDVNRVNAGAAWCDMTDMSAYAKIRQKMMS